MSFHIAKEGGDGTQDFILVFQFQTDDVRSSIQLHGHTFRQGILLGLQIKVGRTLQNVDGEHFECLAIDSAYHDQFLMVSDGFLIIHLARLFHFRQFLLDVFSQRFKAVFLKLCVVMLFLQKTISPFRLRPMCVVSQIVL